METKYFTNLQSALDYTQSIGIDTYSRENQMNIRNNGAVLTTLGQKVGFDIDGFCEVVPNIYVFDYIQMDGTRIQEIRFNNRTNSYGAIRKPTRRFYDGTYCWHAL